MASIATYATWWIKAAIQEYILRSWSVVKMGTTANQKKMFFNLRKAKSKAVHALRIAGIVALRVCRSICRS